MFHSTNLHRSLGIFANIKLAIGLLHYQYKFIMLKFSSIMILSIAQKNYQLLCTLFCNNIIFSMPANFSSFKQIDAYQAWADNSLTIQQRLFY